MNNISIVGRLTKDVEVQTTANGVELARFNVAVPSEFKTETGERKADFFVCVAWRDAAVNISKYFKKGYPIGLFGSMNNRSYEDKDGNTKSIWELNVKGFSFVGSNDPEDTPKGGSKSSGKNGKQMKFEPVDDDNLPF